MAPERCYPTIASICRNGQSALVQSLSKRLYRIFTNEMDYFCPSLLRHHINIYVYSRNKIGRQVA